MALPLPDKPSIAVMPFVNMTGDQRQDFFCDGLSENLIMALSKVPELFVISGQSTFSNQGGIASYAGVVIACSSEATRPVGSSTLESKLRAAALVNKTGLLEVAGD